MGADKKKMMNFMRISFYTRFIDLVIKIQEQSPFASISRTLMEFNSWGNEEE